MGSPRGKNGKRLKGKRWRAAMRSGGGSGGGAITKMAAKTIAGSKRGKSMGAQRSALKGAVREWNTAVKGSRKRGGLPGLGV